MNLKELQDMLLKVDNKKEFSRKADISYMTYFKLCKDIEKIQFSVFLKVLKALNLKIEIKSIDKYK